MRKKKNFFIDLDDTITPTSYRYSQVICEFCCYLYEHFNNSVPPVEDLVKIQLAIDIALIKEYGFLAMRFPKSLVDTYHKVCEISGMKPLKNYEKEILKIGKRVFDVSYYEDNYIDGVEETLEFLLEKGDDLTIVTLGDEKIQWAKIKALKIVEKYLKDEKKVKITKKKNFDYFRKLGKGLNKNNCYMVGDSLRSDIIPSVKNKWNAIYVPPLAGSWKYEAAVKIKLTKEELGRIKEFKKFKEIKERYEEL